MTRWERFKRWLGFKYEPKTKVAARYDDEVVQRYVDAGAVFGDVVSMIYMGECIGFEGMLKAWEEAERDYAALGYRTIDLDSFVGYGGWGKELEGLTVARDEGEEPVYHAAYYREHYLGRNMMVSVEPVGDSGAFTGTYVAPSTRHLNRE
jgi:hypothetical protein